MPLNFDLPLEQLKTYTGINPQPGDIPDFAHEDLPGRMDRTLEFMLGL